MEAALEMVDRIDSTGSSVEINEQQCKRLAQVFEEIGRHLSQDGKNSSNLNMEPLLKVMEAGESLISQCAGPDWFRIALVKAENKEAFEELHRDLRVWFRTIFSTELTTAEFDHTADASHDIQAMLKKLRNIQRKDSSSTPLEGQHSRGMIPKSSLTVALYKVQKRAQFLESLNHHSFEGFPPAPLQELGPEPYPLEERAGGGRGSPLEQRAADVVEEEEYSRWKGNGYSYRAWQSDPLGAENRPVSKSVPKFERSSFSELLYPEEERSRHNQGHHDLDYLSDPVGAALRPVVIDLGNSNPEASNSNAPEPTVSSARRKPVEKEERSRSHDVDYPSDPIGLRNTSASRRMPSFRRRRRHSSPEPSHSYAPEPTVGLGRRKLAEEGEPRPPPRVEFHPIDYPSDLRPVERHRRDSIPEPSYSYAPEPTVGLARRTFVEEEDRSRRKQGYHDIDYPSEPLGYRMPSIRRMPSFRRHRRDSSPEPSYFYAPEPTVGLGRRKLVEEEDRSRRKQGYHDIDYPSEPLGYGMPSIRRMPSFRRHRRDSSPEPSYSYVPEPTTGFECRPPPRVEFDPVDYPSYFRSTARYRRESNLEPYYSYDQEPSYYQSNYLYSRIPDRESQPPEVAIPMSEIAVREEALIGEGSTAQVKKADWLGTPCAVKIFPTDEGARLLRKEVEIHQMLKNTYVVTLIGLAVEGNRCMMLMELMDFNLHDLIVTQTRWFPNWLPEQVHKAGFPSRTPFRLDVAVELMLQIAKGMGYLHDEHKLLHGDLKTQNVLGQHIGTDNYRLKIADFGISQKLSRETPTVTGKHMGSSFFRAPEVLQGTVPFSFEADVYSFAMISYEILTGRMPFEDLRDVSFSRLRREVIGGRRPRLPWNLHRSVRDLVQLCWHQDGLMRPTFFQIRLELERLHKSVSTGTPRSRWWWWEAVLVVLAAVVGLMAFVWGRFHSSWVMKSPNP